MSTTKKQIETLLKKDVISEIDLKGLNLIEIDEKSFELIMTKLNKKEIQTKSHKKEFLSIYKEENDYMVKNKLNSLKNDVKESYFKRLRSKKRNELISLVQNPKTNAVDFIKFCEQTYSSKFDIKNPMVNFNQLSQVKQMLILDFIRKNKIK